MSGKPQSRTAASRKLDADLPQIDAVYIYLHVDGGAAAIDFYRQVFGAREQFRLAYPDGRIAHTELNLGGVMLMLSDEHPEYGIRGPRAVGGCASTIHLHVDDVDRLARRAVDAGAEMLREPTDQMHGERQCRIRDPFGHEWLLGHSTEALSPEEIEARFSAQFEGDAPETAQGSTLPQRLGSSGISSLYHRMLAEDLPTVLRGAEQNPEGNAPTSCSINHRYRPARQRL